MCQNLVEALIVERCHELGIGCLTVRTLNGYSPLLFLTGCKFVAESFPLYKQAFVGQRTSDGMRVPV